MNEQQVSIILRSHNEAWALRETLAALQNQNYRNQQLIVIDSESSDGSVELIKEAKPQQFIQIKASEYNPSRVMNHGMSLATSGICVFLNADATPRDENWLRPLVCALADSGTAAVFGRQIPRPDCKAVYACDYERCFGNRRESARWEHFFSMVNSGLRKEVWARRGFLEKLQYAEDHEYTLWCRSQGYEVRYCPDSVVVHSHNYSPREAYQRSFGDARASAAWVTDERRMKSFWRTVLVGWLSDVRHDMKFCAKNGRLDELPHAAVIRLMQRRGQLAGFREGLKDYGKS